MVKIDFVNEQEPAINDTNLNQMQLNIENAINAQVAGDTLPIGSIMPYTSDTIPENWLLCDGTAISRTEYALLFSIIGTTYGVGDGSTTFNLPNLKGRVAVGKDSTQTEFDTLGETGGEKKHTLTVEEMPSHNHNLMYVKSSDATLHSSGVSGRSENNIGTGTSTDAIQSKGGGQPHNILQPYITTNYIIKARQSAGIVATVVDGLNSTSTTDALSANQGRVLNEKFDYSTTEQIVGTWIDGKPVYRKVVNTGNIQNTSKSVAHNIANLGRVISLTGMANSSGGTYYVLPRVSASSLNQSVGLYVSSTEVRISAGSDASFADSYVVIEYTKTTD